jgi:aspartyl-tRNA(Asn)/glutamyl-tRNA(Gln) amidotransferase subunit B
VALGCTAKDSAVWILTDGAGILRKDGKTLNELEVTAEQLTAIIKMVDKGDINRTAGRKILIAVIEKGVDPVEYCKAEGLDRKVDMSAIEAVIDGVIATNAAAVADYKSGKEKALQAIFGACMRELKGAGDPTVIKATLEQKLKA